jgi:hypothetical protein
VRGGVFGGGGVIVYFSANHRSIARDKEIYDLIVKAINEQGCVLVNNWVEPAWYISQESEDEQRDWQSICSLARQGIDDADVVIAEASGLSGFGVGYEAGYATAKGKPTLILLHQDMVSVSYAAGLVGELIIVENYTRQSVKKKVQDFLTTRNVL